MKNLSNEERKKYRVATGLLKYFPNACLYVGYVSYVANEQHNKGEEMHWAEEKSIGTGDEMVRHYMEKEDYDTDGLLHYGKMAWRAMELLERKIRKIEEEKLSTDLY